jgi:hypothetical protein
VQADSVEYLRKLLNVASGGVVLTPARPRLVGLRAVYVESAPSSSIHHYPEIHAGGERRDGSGVIQAPQHHRDGPMKRTAANTT